MAAAAKACHTQGSQVETSGKACLLTAHILTHKLFFPYLPELFSFRMLHNLSLSACCITYLFPYVALPISFLPTLGTEDHWKSNRYGKSTLFPASACLANHSHNTTQHNTHTHTHTHALAHDQFNPAAYVQKIHDRKRNGTVHRVTALLTGKDATVDPGQWRLR